MKKDRWWKALFAVVGGGRATFYFAADNKGLAFDHVAYCTEIAADWPKVDLKSVKFYGWEEPKTHDGKSLAGVLHIDHNADWRAA